MKKFLICLVLLIVGGAAFAESDLQIGTQPLSLYQAKYITWDHLKYKESLAFRYSGDVAEITNHNYLWNNNKFGIYESLYFMANQFFGVGLSAGPCYKVYDGKHTQMTVSAGVHSTFYSFSHIELGVESDFKAKFLKDKRFSPVAGLCLSFDFFTNGTSDDVVPSGIGALITGLAQSTQVAGDNGGNIERTVEIDKKITKFLAFYVMPYVAFSINF